MLPGRRFRSGDPWRDLPQRFGDPIKIHTRFSCWAKSGAWKNVFEMLAADADNEYCFFGQHIHRIFIQSFVLALEPLGQRFAISDSGLPKTQQLANFSAV